MRGARPLFLVPAQDEADEKHARKSFIYRFYAESLANPFIYRIYEKMLGCGVWAHSRNSNDSTEKSGAAKYL